MNNLPTEVRTHIYDLLLGDAVYWKSEFNKVIQYINRYEDDIISGMTRIGIYEDSYVDLFVFNILRYSL